MRELTITVPGLPPKEWSPNARTHWAPKAKVAVEAHSDVMALVKALNDLLFHSNAHLSQTIQEPGQIGSLNIFGRKLYSWGNLNAAIHRAEQMLEDRKKG